jgi:CheY-like chemotaxis protein
MEGKETNMASILVIDDDARIRMLLRRVLEKEGHSVEEAGNGALGCERQREAGFDLIITDIVMPDQEGVETIRLLRREFPRLPIVAISGGGGQGIDYLAMAKRMGADRILAKPFGNQEVSAAVAELLGPG